LLVADTLQRELKQKRLFRSSAQEGLISIVRTSDQLRRVLERVIEGRGSPVSSSTSSASCAGQRPIRCRCSKSGSG
jgi:hypothetical protein